MSFIGLASAAEVAYFAYIYSIVEKEKYKTVTSYVRSSALSGKLVAFILAQAIVSLKLGSYLLLQQVGYVSVDLLDAVKQAEVNVLDYTRSCFDSYSIHFVLA